MTNEKASKAAERTPLLIWRTMDAERRLKAASAFWKSESVRKVDIEVTAALLAQNLRFRPQSVRTAPLAKKAGWLAGYSAMTEHLAANLLFAYHMEHQISMMKRFLDVCGVPHEEGRIESGAKPPSKAKLAEGVAALKREFDPEDARIYLETLYTQDDEMWGGLASLPAQKAASKA